ncbi:MAG: hypothetical protein GY801_11375 [bacterium]|nr:hypothetical protein [bacterium]
MSAIKEIGGVLAKLEIEEAAETVEHQAEAMEGLARHVHYASKMFGKKVWRKFAKAALEAADELADAFEERDQAAAEAALKKLEKRVMYVVKGGHHLQGGVHLQAGLYHVSRITGELHEVTIDPKKD